MLKSETLLWSMLGLAPPLEMGLRPPWGGVPHLVKNHCARSSPQVFRDKRGKFRWAELAQLMIKVEERFAAFDPPSWPPCMHDQWHGWAQGNRDAERLKEPSRNSHVWKPVFAWFQHVAALPSQPVGFWILIRLLRQEASAWFEVECPSHRHTADQGWGSCQPQVVAQIYRWVLGRATSHSNFCSRTVAPREGVATGTFA